MRTDRRLWLILSAAAFVLLGFVDVLGGTAKVHGSFWGYMLHDLAGWGAWEAPLLVLGLSAVLAVPAAVLGWVAQAVVVTIGRMVAPEAIDRSPG